MKQLLPRQAWMAGAAGIACIALLSIVHLSSGSPEPPATLEVLSAFEMPRYRSSFSPKNESDDAQARGAYEIMRLRDPATGDIPLGMRERELIFVRGLPTSAEMASKTGRLAAQQWSFLGPNNVGGRTRALAVDMDYNGASNRRILAGGISGGMYLSEDDGATWTLTSSLSAMASVTALAQDPNNRNVWYHGTGEFIGNSAGGAYGFSQFLGQGLFKSVNGGRSWAPVLSTRGGSPTMFDNLWDVVWNLAIHSGGAILAATYGGIHRSTDGGDSWQYVLGNDSAPFSTITDVTVAANGTVYAALSRNGSGTANYGVFKSTNGGTAWQSISPPSLATDPYRIVLDAAPSNPSVLYVLVQANQEGAKSTDHQLFRYNDSSGTWTDLSASLPNAQGADGNASFSTQGGYDQMIRVKPDDANTVFIGGVNLYRSTDGGQTFTRIGGYATPANYALYPNQHPDQHAMAFLPTNPNAAVVGHDGGLSKTTNVLSQPHNWTSLNNGYITTQFYTIAMDPRAGGTTVIGGMQDNGTWGTQSTSSADDWFDLFGGDGAYAAVAPGGGTLYISAQNGATFRMSNDGFAFVTPANASRFMFINPFVLDPNNPQVMYMAEGGGVWRNSNLSGIPNGNQEPTSTNWTFLSASAQANTMTTAVTATQAPANRIYFGASDFQTRSAFIRVDQAHSNGQGIDITPPVSTQPFPPFPAAIAAHPGDGDEIIAVFSNYNVESIWHSKNAGASWTNIEGNLGGADGPSVRSAAIVPTDAGTMYFVGTSTGLYSTTHLNDTGTVWSHEGTDVLGNVVVDMLTVRSEDGVIVAGTHGRGAYRAVIGGGGGAAAALDANSVQIAVPPGASASSTITLTNTGSGMLNFNVGGLSELTPGASTHRLQHDPAVLRPYASVPRAQLFPHEGQPPPDGPRPRPARAELPNAGTLAATSDLIILDSGAATPDDFLGWGDGFTAFQWGSRFVTPVGGFTLEGFWVFARSETFFGFPLSVFITDQNGSVYVSGTVPLPSSTLGTWYHITLNQPLALAQGQTFHIELIAPGTTTYPAGAHKSAQVPGAGYYWVQAPGGGSYVSLATVEGFENGAFMIRAEGKAGGGSVNQPPTAVIVASRTEAAVGEAITFDGSGSTDPDGSIAQYAWSFGDGATSNQPVAQHAYTSPGVYTVSLTVTDNLGATGQASRQVNVASGNRPPIAVIHVSRSQALPGESITFDGSHSSDPDGGITAHHWQFGDGGSSNQQIATHAYAQSGSFPVRLTVTDNEGATGQANIQIEVLSEPPRLTASPMSGSIGPGQSQVITVTYDAAGQAAGTYNGRLMLVTNGGTFEVPVSVQIGGSVHNEPELIRAQPVSLEQNFPNPFAPSTTITFTLDKPTDLRLAVFDMHGRMVRVLLEGSRSPGPHRVTWEGDDAGGQPVASGTYFYRLEAIPRGNEPQATLTRKMVVVR
jgi:PKD repeat protein